ncbi:MAG: MFS transporter [Christensenellales bacterium]|jgi:GPH family glycoside/pentoside/hexuronide:cation symporter
MEGRQARRTSPWRFGLGMLGLTIPGYMFSSYGTYYYTEKLSLSLSLIALGTVFYTIWDAVNDPLVGFLSDRTRTRFGRRKPWILIGAPLYFIAMTLFFTPPSGMSPGGGMALYYTAFLMMTETMSTITTVNYHSLFPELFRDTHNRTIANSIRQALQVAAMVLSTVLVPILAGALGYSLLGGGLALLGMGLLVFSVLGSYEDPAIQETRQPGFVESIKAVMSNRNFWTVSFANFFYQATNGIMMAAIPFFVKYTLQLPDSSAAFITGPVFIAAIPAVFGWSAIARKIGAVKTWRLAMVWMGASFIPMLFVTQLWSTILFGISIGVGLAGIIATLDIVNARIIDDDASRFGLRREGIYHSTINFVIRLSSLMKSLVFMLVVMWFGFESSANPGHTPEIACRMMFSTFPLALMALAVACTFMVKIKDTQVCSKEVTCE